MHVAITVDPEIPVPPKLYGGIERIVDMLAQGLTDRGHEVTLLAHPESNTAGRLTPYPGRSSRSIWDTLRNTVHVGKLAANAPDVVHSFGRLAYLMPLLPLRIPKIMSYQREPTPGRIRKAVRLARKQSLIFTGCSEHIAALIRPFAPVHVVYNGVATERYDFKSTVPEDAPLIFLGRIAPIKGTHHAIKVAKESGRRLVIAGNVPDSVEEKKYFDSQIKPYIEGNTIEYVGPVDDSQKNKLLGQSAALLMPIEWEEPFGIVMAEAMACGTPVVGFNRGAVPEVVEEGRTGFVCSSLDAMIEAVGSINQCDRKATRNRCERLFSARAIVDEYLKVYNTHEANPSKQ